MIETDRSLEPISIFVLIYSGLGSQHKGQQISPTRALLKRLSVTAGLFVPLPRQTTNKFKEGPRSRRLPEKKQKNLQQCFTLREIALRTKHLSQVLSAWLAYKFVDFYSQTHVHYNRWLTLHDISYGFSPRLQELINLWKALWWCCAAFGSLQLHSGLICIKWAVCAKKDSRLCWDFTNLMPVLCNALQTTPIKGKLGRILARQISLRFMERKSYLGQSNVRYY